MKPTDYIEWDNLKNIPFFLCQVVEDREKQDLDIYYLGKRVLHDYDHVGHYLRTAVILFRRVKSRTADWVNLRNLWTTASSPLPFFVRGYPSMAVAALAGVPGVCSRIAEIEPPVMAEV